MAAKVKYSINGTHDPKGINDAKKGVAALTDSMETLKKAVGGFIGAKIISDFGKAAFDAVKAYAEVEKSQIRLDYAMRQVGSNFSNINNYINDLGKVSSTSTTDLTKLASEIASLGKSEPEIKRLMTAANNLAEATGMGINEAYKKLNSTFSGTVGEIGKLLPELTTLTKEQLANGDALDIVTAKFSDFNRTTADSTAQKLKNLADGFSTIKEQTGEGLARAFSPFLNVLDTMITKIANSMTKINELQRAIQDVERNQERATLQNRLLVAQDALRSLQAVKTGTGGSLAEQAKAAGGQGTVDAEIRALTNEINGIMQSIASIGRYDLNPDGSPKSTPSGSTPPSSSQPADTKKEDAFLTALKKALSVSEKFNYSMLDGIGKMQADFADEIKPLADILEAPEFLKLPQALQDSITTSYESMTSNFNKELNAAMEKLLLDTNGTSIYSQADRSGANSYRPGEEEGGNRILEETTAGLVAGLNAMGGSVATVTAILTGLATDGDYIGAIIQVIMLAVDGLLSTVGPQLFAVLDQLIKIINDVGAILGSFLTPVLAILTPYLDLIGIILQTALVPILNILSPVLQLVVSLLEILFPVIKAVAIAFEIIMSPIKYIGDLFMWAARQIQIAVHNLVQFIQHPINASKRNILGHTGFTSDAFTGLGGRIANIWDVTNTSAGAGAMAGVSGTGGKSASYSGKRDITVNVSISQSAIADLRDIALLIRNEIKSAEALGY
jgi:hypothetical protein